MATLTTQRLAAFMIVLSFAATVRLHAADSPRVRTETRFLQEVIDHTKSRSSTFAAIVEQIEQSNVIAHVTCEHFRSSTLEGRTLWVSASSDTRYVRVQVDCLLPMPRLVTIVGHELQHVAEISASSTVVDIQSFARLFQTVGFTTCQLWEQFETERALWAGDRVRQEVYATRRDQRTKLVTARQ